MIEQREKLKNLIVGILNAIGEIPKVKLAKMILFCEIEHFRKVGESITGLYFVRLKKGPVIAFFDEVLEEGTGKLWDKKAVPIPIYEENREKIQYSFIPKVTIKTDPGIKKIIAKVVRNYGNKTGTQLSALAHNLPAWKYSEPNEPIFIAELAVKDEKEYFALTDIVEDLDDEDHALAEKISRALFAAKV